MNDSDLVQIHVQMLGQKHERLSRKERPNTVPAQVLSQQYKTSYAHKISHQSLGRLRFWERDVEMMAVTGTNQGGTGKAAQGP